MLALPVSKRIIKMIIINKTITIKYIGNQYFDMDKKLQENISVNTKRMDLLH